MLETSEYVAFLTCYSPSQMPRKYARRPRRKKKKYSVRRSKLADKKINTGEFSRTLFEKRAKQIADKAVKESHEWFKAKLVTADPQFDWPAHGSWLRVPSASCFSLNAATLFHVRLTDLGNILENSLYQPAQGQDSLTNDLRISSFRSKLDFRYAGASDCLIDISIVKVNGSQLLSTQTAIPSIEMVEPLNDLYEYWGATIRQSLDYKFQRVAHRRIKMRPAKLYAGNRLISSAGSNQGYQFQSTANTYTDPQRSVSITKSFKGKGMKLFVQNAARAPQTEYFLLVVADRPVEFTAITCTRFRLEKAADVSQPGNV